MNFICNGLTRLVCAALLACLLGCDEPTPPTTTVRQRPDAASMAEIVDSIEKSSRSIGRLEVEIGQEKEEVDRLKEKKATLEGEVHALETLNRDRFGVRDQ